MKYSCAILLLPISIVALQTPTTRNFVGGATTAAAALMGAPLIAPAAEDVAVVPTTALVVDVKTNSDVVDIAKNVFSHRGQVQQALKDFLNSAKQLEKDLDGVLPPPPEVSLSVPSDAKQAARDALSGQARVMLNGNPVYFEVDSQEGFLTLKAVSPLIPKLPLLAPTAEEAATMVIPRTTTVYVKSSDETLPAAATPAQASKPFWRWSFQLPVVKTEITLPQVVGGVIAGAYGATFGYYKLDNILTEREAEKKRKALAAKKAKKTAKKPAAKISEKMTNEVEGTMAKAAAEDKSEVPSDVSKEEDSSKQKRSLLKKVLRRNDE